MVQSADGVDGEADAGSAPRWRLHEWLPISGVLILGTHSIAPMAARGWERR
jgi:hypothetical protein